MRESKNKGLTDRLENAAKAKQALLEKMRARPGPDDPAVKKRMAERKAIAEAREARAAERKAAREREAAEKAASEKQAALDEANAAVALLAAQKDARDARYAARKKNKKKK